MGQQAQPLKQSVAGFDFIQIALSIEKYALPGIHKGPAQVGSHNPGGEVFSPGGHVVGVVGLPHLGKILAQIQLDPQFLHKLLKTGPDGLKIPVLPGFLEAVEQIGDFHILVRSLPRGGYHHIPAIGVRLDEPGHMTKTLRIRQGGAAEFGNNHCFPLPHLIFSIIITQNRVFFKSGLFFPPFGNL